VSSVDNKIKFIESVFGPGRLSAGGDNISVRCPICDPSDRSKKKLAIHVADDLNHCWVCGWSARNLLPLIVKFGSSSEVEIYKRDFISLSQQKRADLATSLLPKLPSDFKLLALHESSSDPDIKVILRYVHARGLTSHDLSYYALGVSSEFRYRRRVIMPSFDSEGCLNYVVARAIDQSTWLKYLNSENPKTEIIFNDLKIDWKKPLTIVEGPFDLMKCPDNSTCLLGSLLSDEHRLFVKILEHRTPIILCLDADARKKSEMIATKLIAYGISVTTPQLPTDRDPGSFSKSEMIDILKEAHPWTRHESIMSKLRRATVGSLRI
jgi:hypothetical protein